jgi:WD40 repeat protein
MAEAAGAKTRVFLSYSRKDGDFTLRLAEALRRRGFVADFDQSEPDAAHDVGISAEDEWWRRLQQMIAAADTMVFIVSPDSAASRVCDEEIDYARALGKRIIPVLLRPVDFATAPPRLAALNVKLSFADDTKFDASFETLCAALEHDVAWHREGARLTALAVKWDQENRAESLLLPEGAIEGFDAWQTRRPSNASPPGELLQAYVAASRARAQLERDRLSGSSGRAYVKSAEQAVWDARYDAALRAAAAGLIASGDMTMRLVPELVHPIQFAAAFQSLLAMTSGAPPESSLPHPLDTPFRIATERGQAGRVVENGKEVFVLRGYEGGHVALSPDRNLIVAAKIGSHVAHVWRAGTGLQIASLEGHDGAIWSVGFSPDGKRVVTTSADNTAHIWGAETGEAIAVMRGGHDRTVSTASFSPDGTVIATGGWDGLVAIWDAATGRQLGAMRAHDNWVLHVAFESDGRRLVSTCKDGVARVWSAEVDFEIARVSWPDRDPACAILSPDGSRVIVTGRDGAVRLWAWPRNDAGKSTAELRKGGGECVALSADGGRIVTTSFEQAVELWDAATGQRLASRKFSEKVLAAAAVGGKTARVVTASNGEARIHDLEGGSAISLHGHAGPVIHAGFDAEAKRVVTVGSDRTVRTWDAASAGELAHISAQNAVAAHLSPNGGRVLVPDPRDGAVIYDALTGAEITALKHAHAYKGVSFSADGARVATPFQDTVRVWDASSGEMIASLVADAEVQSANFSRDGDTLLSVIEGGTLVLWDVSRTAALCGPPAEILAASLSDGRGRRTAREREDSLMQSAPADLYDALMQRLSPQQQASVAQRATLLRRPLHENCYRVKHARSEPKATTKPAPPAKPPPALHEKRSGVSPLAVVAIALFAVGVGAGALFLLARAGLVTLQ